MASPRTSKEVQIFGSMDYRRWLMQMCDIEWNRNCQKYIYKDERYVDIMEITFRDQKMSSKVLCTFHLFVCLRIMDKNKQMEDKINAFEMWIFQRMFRISHLDRKTNVKVLEMAKAKKHF